MIDYYLLILLLAVASTAAFLGIWNAIKLRETQLILNQLMVNSIAEAKAAAVERSRLERAIDAKGP